MLTLYTIDSALICQLLSFHYSIQKDVERNGPYSGNKSCITSHHTIEEYVVYILSVKAVFSGHFSMILWLQSLYLFM